MKREFKNAIFSIGCVLFFIGILRAVEILERADGLLLAFLLLWGSYLYSQSSGSKTEESSHRDQSPKQPNVPAPPAVPPSVVPPPASFETPVTIHSPKRRCPECGDDLFARRDGSLVCFCGYNNPIFNRLRAQSSQDSTPLRAQSTTATKPHNIQLEQRCPKCGYQLLQDSEGKIFCYCNPMSVKNDDAVANAATAQPADSRQATSPRRSPTSTAPEVNSGARSGGSRLQGWGEEEYTVTLTQAQADQLANGLNLRTNTSTPASPRHSPVTIGPKKAGRSRPNGQLVEILFPPSFVAAVSKVPTQQIRVLIRQDYDDATQWNPNPHDWFLDWMKYEGDSVREGEPLAVLIDTIGTTAIDVSSPVDGVLTKILAKQGVVPLGRVLAVVIAHPLRQIGG